MSNTRKAKWSEAEVTAANAESLLAEFWAEGEAYARARAARRVVTGRIVADMTAAGAAPGLVARMEQEQMALGDGFWLEIADQILGSDA